MIASLEAVAITTATCVPEGGTGLSCIIVEPGRGIAIAFSRLRWQCADGVGLKRGETDKRLDHFYHINPFHACLPPQVLEVVQALEVLGVPEVLEVALVVVVPAPACHNNPDRVAP